MKITAHLRPHEEADINFLYNSWLKSLKQAMPAIDSKIFYDNHKKIIQKLIPRSKIIVSCNPEDFEQIFGYIVQENFNGLSLVHYIYVKHPYRRYGIASSLVDAIENESGLPHVATHHTRVMESISLRWGMIFNPYILLRDDHGRNEDC